MRGWPVTLRVELRKLSAQVRVRVALAACLAGPVLFAAALSVQSSTPTDTLFGRWVDESGYAVSLVVLGFSGQWVIPVVVSVVAGDICASEDQLGTWSMVLTRSRSREEVLAGKVLASALYSVACVVALAASSLAAGLVASGSRPLVSLSGAVLPPGTAAGDVALSWLSVLVPTLAFAAIAVCASVLARNSWVGVVTPVVAVLVLDLLSLLSAVDPVRPWLPTTGFEAWHGFVRSGAYTGPLLQAVGTDLLWSVLALALAARLLRRRDITA